MDTYVIVTHGEFANRLLQRALRVGDAPVLSFFTDNTSATHLVLDSPAVDQPPLCSLKALNVPNVL